MRGAQTAVQAVLNKGVDMIKVKHPNGRTGLSVGQRKDGSRAVLWSDETVQWYTAAEFASLSREV